MAQIEIQCINKTNRYDAHERISHVGGINNGIRWKKTQPAVITEIENGTNQYYVRKGGQVVAVIVATSRWGNKYLKTVPDGEQPDNLLSLPECP